MKLNVIYMWPRKTPNVLCLKSMQSSSLGHSCPQSGQRWGYSPRLTLRELRWLILSDVPNGTHPESARPRLQVICFLDPHREQGLRSLLMKATHSLGRGPCTHLCADTHWVWNRAVKWPSWGTNPLLGIKSLAKCLLFKFPGPSIVIFIPLRLGKKNQSWIWSVF